MDEQAAEAIVKSLDTEAGKNLLGPITREIGEFGGSIGDVLRYYGTQALESIFTKWARQRRNQPLSVEDFARVRPLLLPASFQTEDELQERWAALLESVVSNPNNVLPSFGQTLSQLTADEASFLTRIHASLISSVLKRAMSRDTLLAIYDPELKFVSYADYPRLKSRIEHACLLIQDLERLGFLLRQQESGPLAFENWQETVKLTTTYSLSDYGLRFIEAVTPRDRKLP